MSINLDERLLYDYESNLGTFCLTNLGVHYLRKRDGSTVILEWFKDSKTGKPWIVGKRKTFVSLVKQAIREGDYDKL